MHFLVIDDRFPSPVYVFLETDPRQEEGFPGLPVHQVTLERQKSQLGCSLTMAVGRHVGEPALFREFASDRAVAAGLCLLIEPRYIGPSWKAYTRVFRLGGK